MPTAETDRKKRLALRYVIILLGLSVFINYIDRGNLSIAAPMLKDELGLTGSQLGILLSAFFWTYGFAQILSGWLVDRFSVSWIMAIGFFLWSAATGVTGVVHGFTSLLIVRFVLGVGESVAYPSYSRILAKYFPASQRATANSLIASGQACGPAFGMLAGGMLMSRFGWRSFFVVLSLASMLWLLPWFRFMPRGPGLVPATLAEGRPSIIQILRKRTAWGTFLGLFCNAYSLYFLIAWLPYYLVRERHFSMDAMAKIGGAVYLTQAVFSFACGQLSDRWIALGASRTKVHMTFMTVGLLGNAGFLLLSAVAAPRLAVVMLLLTGASCGLTMASTWPITQTVAGPAASGRWTGLQCAFGNSSGALASALTGLILDSTGQFLWSFVVAAAFCVLGVFTWIGLVCPVEPTIWEEKRQLEVPDTGVEPS